MQLGLTAEQIAARRLGIGGSDAGAIVAGGHDLVQLWKIKTGRAEPDDLSNVLAVQMGNATEEFNAFWYTKQTGREVTARNQFARHRTIPYLFANLDGITTSKAGQPAYIDFKHVGKAGEHLTLRYTAQCTHAAIVASSWLGYPVDDWCLSVLVGNSKWELIEQEIDPFFAADYLDMCSKFWACVTEDREPEIEALPVPAPRKLRTISLADVDREAWPNWGGELLPLIRDFVETEPAAKKHAIAREDIKKLVPDDVGVITRGLWKFHRDKAGAVRISTRKAKEGEQC